jgi:cell division protein FtsB
MHTLPNDEGIAGFSIKALLLTALGILLFGIYVGILIYGENSLTVLNQLKEKKAKLKAEGKALKSANQKLQKSYFEFKQLVPKQLEDGAL